MTPTNRKDAGYGATDLLVFLVCVVLVIWFVQFAFGRL